MVDDPTGGGGWGEGVGERTCWGEGAGMGKWYGKGGILFFYL